MPDPLPPPDEQQMEALKEYVAWAAENARAELRPYLALMAGGLRVGRCGFPCDHWRFETEFEESRPQPIPAPEEADESREEGRDA